MSAGVGELLLQIRALGLPAPVQEHRFHKRRRWRLDLAWPEALLGVEVHGGVWRGGRHNRGRGFTSDREKMNEAVCAGWRILEVTTDQVRSGQAATWLQRLLNIKG